MNILKTIKDAFYVTEKITEDDLLKIRQADWPTLAKWWDELNSWGWPKELLPEDPPLFVLQPSQEKLLEGTEGRFTRKAGIKILVILVGFEPEPVGIGKEHQTEDQEEN